MYIVLLDLFSIPRKKYFSFSRWIIYVTTWSPLIRGTLRQKTPRQNPVTLYAFSWSSCLLLCSLSHILSNNYIHWRLRNIWWVFISNRSCHELSILLPIYLMDGLRRSNTEGTQNAKRNLGRTQYVQEGINFVFVFTVFCLSSFNYEIFLVCDVCLIRFYTLFWDFPSIL